MPKPCCLRCQCFYRPLKNGVRVLENMPVVPHGADRVRDNEEIRGRRSPGEWAPYKLWVADLWECPDCGHQLVTGFGGGPVVERHHAEFNQTIRDTLTRDEYGRGYQINDC